MAMALTMLAIVAASFALGVSFAEIRAEIERRLDGRNDGERRAR